MLHYTLIVNSFSPVILKKVPAGWDDHVARVYYIGLQSSVQANNQFEYKLDAAMNRPIATTAAARSSNSVPRSCMYLRLYVIMEGRGLGRYGRASVRSNGGCVESCKTTFSEGCGLRRGVPTKSKKIRVELSASSKETNAQKNGWMHVNRTVLRWRPAEDLRQSQYPMYSVLPCRWLAWPIDSIYYLKKRQQNSVPGMPQAPAKR